MYGQRYLHKRMCGSVVRTVHVPSEEDPGQQAVGQPLQALRTTAALSQSRTPRCPFDVLRRQKYKHPFWLFNAGRTTHAIAKPVQRLQNAQRLGRAQGEAVGAMDLVWRGPDQSRKLHVWTLPVINVLSRRGHWLDMQCQANAPSVVPERYGDDLQRASILDAEWVLAPYIREDTTPLRVPQW